MAGLDDMDTISISPSPALHGNEVHEEAGGLPCVLCSSLEAEGLCFLISHAQKNRREDVQ